MLTTPQHPPATSSTNSASSATVDSAEGVGATVEQSTPTSGRTWPDVYHLPDIPKRISDSLQQADCITNADTTAVHQLIRLLFDDVAQYTL